MNQLQLVEHVQARFPSVYQRTGDHNGQHWVEIERSGVVQVLRSLRDEIGFDFLMDVTCVDWKGHPVVTAPERFSVVYQLYHSKDNVYFRVKAWVPEGDAEIATVSGLWKCATWAEREVWDLFGIRFAGLADHRRILMPADYTGHPLRKDYPLTGHGERTNFPRFVK